RWRARRLGLPRAPIAHGGKAAPVDPHAASARPGAGRAAHRRVHRVCARKGLSQAGAVDAKPPGRGAAHLRVARIPAHESRTQRRFRQKAHQRNLGAEAIAPALIAAAVSSVLVHAGAAEVALIFSLFPLLTMLFSGAVGRERITPALVAGVLVSIAGVALSLTPKLGAHGQRDWWGEIAVVASATIGAACSLLYRPYLQRYPTVPVSALAMLASVGVLAVAAWPEAWPSRIPSFSAVAWAAIAFVGISSAIGYFTWLYALKHESPTRVTVFLALNPPAAALCGWALLGEPVHPAV